MRIATGAFLVTIMLVSRPGSAAESFSLSPTDSLYGADGNAWRWIDDPLEPNRKFLQIDPAHSVWVHDKPRHLNVPDQFRLEAWMRAEPGCTARIEFVLFDAESGAEIRAHTIAFVAGTPSTSRGVPSTASGAFPTPGPFARIRDGWRYLACDTPLEADRRAYSYNIRISSNDGPVDIDGLRLVGADSILPNGDFSDPEPLIADARLPRGWRRAFESKNASLESSGTFVMIDANGTPGIEVSKTEGTFLLSVTPVPRPERAKALVGRARIAGDSEQVARVVVRQLGARGVSSEDVTMRNVDRDGTLEISTHPIEWLPEANRVMFLIQLPQRAGTYRVFDAELVSLEHRDDQPVVFVDQTGYNTDEPLRFVVANEVFPIEGLAQFILTGDNGLHASGDLTALGRAVGQGQTDWGAYYFEGIVSNPAPGVYKLEATLGGRTAIIEDVVVAPNRRLDETGNLAYTFYSIQRCGREVPGWHGLCHMDDAKLPDGTHVDVTGGYHNAGDLHKHTGDNTPVSAYAMARLYTDHKSAFADNPNGAPSLLDETQWGADWLLKMLDPKSGRMWANVTNDIDYFGIPEHDTDGIIGTGDDRLIGTGDSYDLGGFEIAAWAILGELLPDAPYASAAQRLWEVYEPDILKGRDPRHIIAAAALFDATGADRYRSAADTLTQSILEIQNPAGWFAASPDGLQPFRIVDEGTIPAALAIHALTWPDSSLNSDVRSALRRYFESSLRLADNPFGVIRHVDGGEPFYFKSRDEWFGGSNSAYCSVAWAAYLTARVFDNDPEFAKQLRAHAANQIHWILGMNPLSLCMFEGKGNSNRIKYHHLYAEIPGHPRGDVPGTIPNGIIRTPDNADRPWFDFREVTGTLPGAESAEPWLPHNAYYLLALAATN